MAKPQQTKQPSNEHNKTEHEAKVARLEEESDLTGQNEHNVQEHEAKIAREKAKKV